jgi:tetratricopeptide (TPR) repeat protein
VTANSENHAFEERVRAAVGERYADMDRVGGGGMAVVFRGRDRASGDRVAIKVFRPELGPGVNVTRFQQESRISSGFQHPNIVPVIESGVADDLLYLVMPYVDGETLAERIRSGPLSVEEAARVVRDVGEGLTGAHRAGYLHRDIKPSNIILGADGAVLTDFGVAKALVEVTGDRMTQSGVSVGTPTYMSPEQGAGERKLDPRSDQYSLACVLYEALVGEPPFTGPTSVIVIARHVAETPPSISVARPGVPRPIVAAVERALSKTPADRFASVRDFIAALDRPASSTPRIPIWARWAASAMTVAGVGWLVFGALADPAPLDGNTVLVFPPEAPGYESDVGDQVATFIGYVLEGTDPLVWKEGRDWIPSSEAGAVLSLAEKTGVARRAGARYYVDGSVIRDVDSVTVILRLVDAQTDRVVGRAGRAAPLADASEARLGARAMGSLLGALIEPGRVVDLGALADRSPVAIARFHRGEVEYRRSRFTAALEHYRAASAADAAFPLAAVKAAEAAHWSHDLLTAAALADSALAQDSLLPARYAAMARAVADRFAGRADSALTRFRALRERYPDWAEAAAGEGEILYHSFPTVTASRDSLAREAFGHAVRLDSTFTPPLYHLAEIAVREGEIERARMLVERLEQLDFDRDLSAQLHIMTRCAAEGPEALDWEAISVADQASLISAGQAMAASVPLRACALAASDAAFRADAPVRWGPYLLYHGLLVAEERGKAVRDLLASERAAGLPAHTMLLIDAVGDPSLAPLADSVYRARRSSAAENSPTVWLYMSWATRRGWTDDAATFADTLVARIRSEDRRSSHLGAIARAHAALAAGDRPEAIRRFSDLRATAPEQGLVWDPWEALVLERLLLARLLVDQGRAGEAEDVLRDMGSHRSVMDVWLSPEMERLLDAAKAVAG